MIDARVGSRWLLAGLLCMSGLARADAKSDALAEMDKAQEHLDRGEFDAAIARFNVARSLVPESSGPLLGLGIANARAGHCEQAIPFLEEYLKRKAKGAKPEAREALDDCKRRLPKSPGKLSVTTDPPGAEVRVDDPNGPVSGLSPFESTSLPFGPHRIILAKSGYVTAVSDVTISSGVLAQVVMALVPQHHEAPPPVVIEPPRRPVTPPSLEPAAPPLAPGKVVVEVAPVPAVVSLNGIAASEPKREFEGPVAAGPCTLLVEKDGYRSVSGNFTVGAGETVTRKIKLQPLKRSAWLGLAIPMTLVAAGAGIGALVTFYAADGHADGPDFQTNKTANAALQGVFYPSLAAAAIGYVLYGVLNRGRVSDGPPLSLSLAPTRDGGTIGARLRF